ncbi:MAG: hypothetical protein EOO39_46755, partial [Cytophagaceae bacterium]
NYGCLLKGDGKGEFKYVNQTDAGLSVIGDVKSVVEISTVQGRNLLIGAFNQPLQVYKKQMP